MASLPDNGLIHLRNHYSVPETLKRLESILRAKDLTVFSHVDHSGEAEKVGLKMRPTQLIVFGSPKAGTPLMVASPTLAIDLRMTSSRFPIHTNNQSLINALRDPRTPGASLCIPAPSDK